ncbi:PPE domain-containing protein [Kutzneria sp. 744]|uniref:PPE domain-containing protein n=1 Tax=Kutzneria sp. (strain 744) TaxID=345341 RepID=UPI0003EEAC9D|nr:PPE domain-containing protein [Kutzneria sp. 744]EWM15870.1 RNA-binding protein [Kutzneria sp. 744]
MSWIGDAWNKVEDAGASVLGIDGPSQSESDQQKRDQANQRGSQQRNEYNRRASQLEQQAGGGYDPAGITKQTNWNSMGHDQIKKVSDGLDPAAIGTHGNDWIQLGKDLQTSTDTFNTAINSALNGNWTGAAGDAALAAPKGIVDWSKDFGNQMQATGAQAQSVSATADQVKSTVPPPKDFSWGKAAVSGILGGPFGAGASAYAQHQEQQEAKEQAVRVMSSVYSPNYMNAANSMPAFTGPADPTQPPPPPPPPPPPISEWPPNPPPGGHPPGGHTQYNPNQVGNPNHQNSQQQNPPQLPPDRPPYDPTQDPNNPNNPNYHRPPTGTTTQSSNWPVGTDGDGNVPNYPGYPGQGGGGRGGGQGGGGGGFTPPMGSGFGGGGGSGYGGGGAGGGFGSGGAKGFGSGATSGAGARAGAGATSGFGAEEEGAMRGGAMGGRPGAAGASGAGGMGGGGRGGKKEEDKEHKSAAYLVNDDNANDIVGDLPPTVPPVIGG